METNLGQRQVTIFGLGQQSFGPGIIQAVQMGLAGAAGQLIQNQRDSIGLGLKWQSLETERGIIDTLFDALRIPGQIIVHHQGTELEIDALSFGLGSDHDTALFSEIVHQRRTYVGDS